MAIEDLEFVRRKIGAIVLILIGIFGMIYSGYITITSKELAGGLILLCFFGFIAIYGGYLWKKVTHVVWTKQAIREVMDREMRAEADFQGRYSQSPGYQKGQFPTCPQCGVTVDTDDTFCPDCGVSLLTEKTCSNCNATIAIDEVFCSECGAKQRNDKTIRTCPNCGSNITVDNSFCEECGQKLREESHDET
jgi:RNA polymerase subunit RPABC4/transcription elongation factor Spt4